MIVSYVKIKILYFSKTLGLLTFLLSPSNGAHSAEFHMPANTDGDWWRRGTYTGTRRADRVVACSASLLPLALGPHQLSQASSTSY